MIGKIPDEGTVWTEGEDGEWVRLGTLTRIERIPDPSPAFEDMRTAFDRLEVTVRSTTSALEQLVAHLATLQEEPEPDRFWGVAAVLLGSMSTLAAFAVVLG